MSTEPEIWDEIWVVQQKLAALRGATEHFQKIEAHLYETLARVLRETDYQDAVKQSEDEHS